MILIYDLNALSYNDQLYESACAVLHLVDSSYTQVNDSKIPASGPKRDER